MGRGTIDEVDGTARALEEAEVVKVMMQESMVSGEVRDVMNLLNAR